MHQAPVLGTDGIIRFEDQDQYQSELKENLLQGRLFCTVKGDAPTGNSIKFKLEFPDKSGFVELCGKPIVKTQTQIGFELENFDVHTKTILERGTANEMKSEDEKNDSLQASVDLSAEKVGLPDGSPGSGGDQTNRDADSLAIAGMAMISTTPLQGEWGPTPTPTHPRESPLGSPGMSTAANPAFENMKTRAETAEKRVYEFQYYTQQILTQLSQMTRRAEMAEQYAAQMQQRAEYAEYLLAQKEQGTKSQATSEKEKRKAEWIESRREKSKSPSAEFDGDYLNALELMSQGKHQDAVDVLQALVKHHPKTVSYRTALHLAEGFKLQEQGLNPELTRRFERAMLIEANEGKPAPQIIKKD